jgi:hypothetical protein
MKRNQWRNRIGVATLALSLLLGAGFILNATAQTQYPQYPNDRNDQDRNNRDRNWDGIGNYGGSAELRQTALNAGYNEGIKAASDARQNGRQSDYRNINAYQKATKDYSWRLGDRELYRRYFREAFVNAYNANGNNQSSLGRDDRYRNRDRNRNWNRNRRDLGDDYGNYGGSFDLRQTALNAGYNEGIKQGRNDRNKRHGTDYRNQSAYQKATQDYSSKLGDRELYRRYYQEAYPRGYEAGLSGN